jgi:hypothetical protein
MLEKLCRITGKFVFCKFYIYYKPQRLMSTVCCKIKGDKCSNRSASDSSGVRLYLSIQTLINYLWDKGGQFESRIERE